MFLRYGKEYGAPATRLLFERTLALPLRVVGTLTNIFKTNIPILCTLAY